MNNKQISSQEQEESIAFWAKHLPALNKQFRDSGLTELASEESDGEYTATVPQGKRRASPASLPDLQNLPEDPALGAMRARDKRLQEQSTTGSKKG